MESVDVANIHFDSNGLVPAVIQDYRNGKLLMMAYMNLESLQRTIESGQTWFYSRSRRCLWHKGEESGHFQQVKEISVDCDADTIAIQVIPNGPACHTNNISCFYRGLTEWGNKNNREGRLYILDTLFQEIKEKRIHPSKKSYTNYLQKEGKDKIDKKIGEEAAEVIIANQHQNKKEIVEESCDLLYHLFVMWENSGIDLYDVMATLKERNRVKDNKKEVEHIDKTF